MINFKILKKSRKSRARIGILKTPHGEIETPTLIPVATQAVVKTLTSEQVEQTKTQILIANTFHLHLKPGEGIVERAGGLHKFMNWEKPLMTDSAGFQVFSLGFGKDFNVGKMLKFFPGQDTDLVKKGSKPSEVNITEFGVYFRSPVDGSKLFIGPKESIKIQKALGADIMFAFDECTPPLSSYEYAKKALLRTHKWAKTCLETRNTKQALYGIVQGSKFNNLRNESAKFINGLGFDGFGIGGDLGESKETMHKIIRWCIPHLDENKPRHLLGVGHLEDIPEIIKLGIDTFDCTAPTHNARHGIAFTSSGKISLDKRSFLTDKNPLDKNCKCIVCQKYRRNYISHLVRANEFTAMSLLTMHNLYFFNSYIESIRKKIKEGKI